ncbi:NETI motif-containing protein [Bacillus sp. 165]|uniref:NETI motif-containing protein n=1 Tax=Bacillus sp. 165 TaxID=1529117 RepID=UPI001AD9554B|nr:NETI motif-containing protein [Bacillus sp. 165]MBO9129196.1 NETI motif-containing protein [Bacillus sp. 165]
MSTQKKKKRFEVLHNESIEQCLERMKKEGYMPVRRTEEPIFHEVEKEGKTIIEPCGRTIVFEGKLFDA